MDQYRQIDFQVLEKLLEIAKTVAKYYVRVDKPGKYTAAQLYQRKNALGEKILILYDYDMMCEHKVYQDCEQCLFVVEVGTFKCSFPVQKLFEIVYRFEKICNVTQKNKVHFQFGEEEYEVISEKAMYLDREGKAITRKKTLVKLSERVAIERDKKTKRYNMYYFFAGMWYLIATNYDESQYKAIKERIEKYENFLFGLLQRWDLNTENRLNPIYKALFEALKSERANSTPEERKSENEPENEFREIGKGNIESIQSGKDSEQLQKEIHKNEVSVRSEYLRRYNPSYKSDYPIMFAVFTKCGTRYYTSGWSSDLIFEIPTIREKVKKFDMYLVIEEKDFSQIGETIFNTKGTGYFISVIDIKECRKRKKENIIFTVIRSGNELPKEISDTKSPEKDGTSETSNYKTISYHRPIYRPICDHAAESANSWGNCCPMFTYYLRQKVFPYELFHARRKISRFKPRCFVGYTSYHILKENALERKINGTTSVYNVLIRGET